MYCTPCARLMRSITPNTRVSPAATRNNRMPSCNPFRSWTTNRVADMTCLGVGPLVQSPQGEAAGPVPGSFQRALAGVCVGIALKHALHDLRLELAVGALGDLDQIEVLDREAVRVEAERSAHR